MKRKIFSALLFFAMLSIFSSAFGQQSPVVEQQKPEDVKLLFSPLLCISALSLSVLCFCFGIKGRMTANPRLFNLKKISLVFGGTLLIMAGLEIWDAYSNNHTARDFSTNQLVTIGFPILCLFIFFRDGGCLCPSCARLVTAVPTEMKLVDGHVTYKNVKRQEHIKNQRGETVYTVEKDETVPIEVKTHRHHYKCPVCCHQWTKLKTTESQA